MNAEMRLLNIIDREASGTGRIVKATFELHADDAEFLRGKAGKRFGAALVEIGDDEKPVATKAKPNHAVMTAGRLCADPVFQKYCEQQYPYTWKQLEDVWKQLEDEVLPPDRAASVVRHVCGIRSRKDLETDHTAAMSFESMVAKFEMWKRGE